MEVEVNEIMISQGFPREKARQTKEMSGLLFSHLAPGIPTPWILMFPKHHPYQISILYNPAEQCFLKYTPHNQFSTKQQIWRARAP